MKNLHLESSLAVAQQVINTSSAFDLSISEIAALADKVVTASRSSELAPADTQKILQAMAGSFAKVVEGRAEFVSAHQQMIELKQDSDHAETGFGCWGDGPLVNPSIGKIKLAA